jgi:Protein of unknown function (DUF1570)
LAPAGLRADLIYFAQGGRVQVPAESRGDGTVRLEIPGGPAVFAASDFRKIVPGYWPEQQWPQRLRAAEARGEADRFTSAWWALANGLTPQAERLFREANLADPDRPATARLVPTLDRLARVGTDPNLESINRALGGSFEVARSPHVLLLHQHSAAEAAERVEFLERIVVSYYLLIAAGGLDLPVPEHRLVSAWFAEHHDYLAFLHTEGADAFRTTLGYYHPTLGAVVTYDVRSAPAQRQAREAALLRANETRDTPRRRLLLEMDRRSLELGTAAHEMVHLLVAQSGLAPRNDDFPLWLHEGLAAQFEVVRGGRWAGFGHAHDLRLPDWRKIDPPARLVPLVRDAGFGRGYSRDAYAAAWALVYYLRKEHPAQFLTFLDLLRIPDPEPRPHADRTIALFKAAFGDDLHTLEADWHRVLATLRTPLEEGQ